MEQTLDALIRKLNDSEIYRNKKDTSDISHSTIKGFLLTCETPVAKYLRVRVNFSAGLIDGREVLL